MKQNSTFSTNSWNSAHCHRTHPAKHSHVTEFSAKSAGALQLSQGDKKHSWHAAGVTEKWIEDAFGVLAVFF